MGVHNIMHHLVLQRCANASLRVKCRVHSREKRQFLRLFAIVPGSRANRKLPDSLERTCSHLGPEVMTTKRLGTAAASSKKVKSCQDQTWRMDLDSEIPSDEQSGPNGPRVEGGAVEVAAVRA